MYDSSNVACSILIPYPYNRHIYHSFSLISPCVGQIRPGVILLAFRNLSARMILHAAGNVLNIFQVSLASKQLWQQLQGKIINCLCLPGFPASFCSC